MVWPYLKILQNNSVDYIEQEGEKDRIWDGKTTSFKPSHEIMALFVLRKLILQTRMCSHPVGLDVWCFCRTLCLLPYFMCANSEGSGETARMRRLVWAFAGHHVISTISWAGSNNGQEWVWRFPEGDRKQGKVENIVVTSSLIHRRPSRLRDLDEKRRFRHFHNSTNASLRNIQTLEIWGRWRHRLSPLLVHF